MAGLCLLFIKSKDAALWRWLAAPGRMALTNYIGQSAVGMFIFYGIGLGLGADIGLSATELIAIGIFLLQMLASRFWLAFCQFGPLEWIWRMLNYGKTFFTLHLNLPFGLSFFPSRRRKRWRN